MASNLLSRGRLVATAASGFLVAGLLGQLPADAAPGAGTWTRITSPGDATTVVSQDGHEGHVMIRGTASGDVPTVNVYCLAGSGSSVVATTVATAVAVTGGSFQTTVPVPGSLSSPRCRLRALPDGVGPQTVYLASYAGPVMNLDSWRAFSPFGTRSDFEVRASTGEGTVVADSLGACSAAVLATVLSDQTVPGGSDGCLYALPGQNVAGTRSAVQVDGRNAYSTAGAAGFGLTSTHALRLSVTATKSGTVRWVDTEVLDRCAQNVFPPTSGTCSLVSTGVEVRQVSTLLASGHQVTLRTTFRSLDGKRHALLLDYQNHVSRLATGDLGFRFPDQKSFRASATGETVTSLGKGTGTMLVRSDRFGAEGDPVVSTRSLTWSRPPSRIRFSATDPQDFEMAYRLTVPKARTVALGFTDSEGILTSRARALGVRGERGMMPAPRITSPVKGRVVSGPSTRVVGVVKAGANGLPTSVKVNGHRARLKAKGGSRATFKVALSLSPGKHTLTAVAVDAAGNRRTSTVTITVR